MTTIRIVDAEEARAVLPDLSEILSDCINGGASVGFMLPFEPSDATGYWQEIADAVEKGSIILAVAEVEGRVVGTVQVGLASKPNQPHRGDLMKLLVHRSARGHGRSRQQIGVGGGEAARFWCWTRQPAARRKAFTRASDGNASGSFPIMPCGRKAASAARRCSTSG